MIDSLVKKDENYYQQLFLEEYKYNVKEKKTKIYIKGKLEISFDESDKQVSEKPLWLLW